ncbi:MAG: DUF6378 domain-containing protein [Rhodospirillaceae bacterium]
MDAVEHIAQQLIEVEAELEVMTSDRDWWREKAMANAPGEGGIGGAPARAEVTGGTVLAEADRIVNGPRQDAYGHPSVNHACTARMWSAYLGTEITPRQVCMLNILQKCSRDAHEPKRDNLVDVAGWAENAEMVEAG